MIKAILSLIMLCSIQFIVSGQEQIKFKKIEKGNLQAQSCKYDSEAIAEYLYHSCKVEFRYVESKGVFEVLYKFHDRIKIYDESAFDFADQVISYYSEKKGASEKLRKIEAYTFNLVNGKVKEEKLSKKNIYEDEVNKFYKSKKFAMPAVKKGSILEIRYELSSPFILDIKEFYFQQSIPVRDVYYEVEIPEFYNYNYNLKGLLALDIIEGRKKGTITFAGNKLEHNRQIVAKKRSSSESISFDINTRSYSAEKVLGQLKEPYVLNMDNYKSSVRLELLSSQFFDRAKKFYTLSWDDIATDLNLRSDFGEEIQLNIPSYDAFISEISKLEANARMQAIYSKVQREFVWNGYSGETSHKGIKNMLKSGSGNSAELNLLLVNLLRKSGFEAFPIVSKTRANGFLNLTNPTRADLSYVMAAINYSDRLILFDATDPYLEANMIPRHAINLRGVAIIGKQGTLLEIANPNRGDDNLFYTLQISGKKLVGKYQRRLMKYEAYLVRTQNKNSADYKKWLSNDNVHFTSFEEKNFDNNSKPLNIKAEVELFNHIDMLDNKIFLDLLIGQGDFKNPFTAETRDFPIFFENAYNFNRVFKIAIPEGYEVESLPENLNITTAESTIQFIIEVKESENQLIVSIRNSVSATIIVPADYPAVKEQYEKVEAKLKEKIVLKKI